MTRVASKFNMAEEVSPGVRELQEKAYQTIEQVADCCNSFGHDIVVDAMVRSFVDQHRTLQQSMVRVFVRVLTEWVTRYKEPMIVDDRNEATYQFAKKLANDPPALPLI